METTEIQLVHATEEGTYETEDHDIRDGKAIPVVKTLTRHEHLYDDVPVHDADDNPVMITAPAKAAVTDSSGIVIREAQPERTFQKIYRVPRMVEREVPVIKKVSRPGRRNHLGFLASDVKAGFDKHAPGMDYGVYVKGEDGTEHLRPDQLIPVLWKALQELSQMVTEKDQKAVAIEADLGTMKSDIAMLKNAMGPMQ